MESTEERKVVRPELRLEKREFDGTEKTKIMTSNDLCKAISSGFSKISNDFQGTRIYIDHGFLQAELYFSVTNQKDYDSDTNSFKFVDTIQNIDSKKNIFERFNSLNKKHIITLTENGKWALKPFIPEFNRARKIPYFNSKREVIWNNACFESSVDLPLQNFMYRGSQVVTLLGVAFDPIKFLKKLYGTTNEKGEVLEYAVVPIRPINPIKLPNGNMYSSNHLLSITQFNRNLVARIAKDTNVYQQPNYLNIIKD